MPYVRHIVNNMNSKKTPVHTIRNDYTTDDDMSITERCDKSIRHSSLVWQTAAIVDMATHSIHSSLVVSQTNRLTRQHERISAPSPCPNLDTFTLRPKMTKKMSSDQTNSSLLFNSLFNSLRLNSLRLSSPDNHKHNDTVNLHAQNCCTQKLKFNSSKNLPKCVQIKA